MSEYKERQEDEVEFLQAVFFNPGDFQDLRKNDSWKVRRFLMHNMNVDIEEMHYNYVFLGWSSPRDTPNTSTPEEYGR